MRISGTEPEYEYNLIPIFRTEKLEEDMEFFAGYKQPDSIFM